MSRVRGKAQYVAIALFEGAQRTGTDHASTRQDRVRTSKQGEDGTPYNTHASVHTSGTRRLARAGELISLSRQGRAGRGAKRKSHRLAPARRGRRGERGGLGGWDAQLKQASGGRHSTSPERGSQIAIAIATCSRRAADRSIWIGRADAHPLAASPRRATAQR